MITINITIEAELNEQLDDTMFLKEETEKKLDNLMIDLENQLTVVGLDKIMVNYDFYDDDTEFEEDILSEGLTVTEIARDDNGAAGWNAEEEIKGIGEVEEEGSFGS